jgi:hypothetical protein
MLVYELQGKLKEACDALEHVLGEKNEPLQPSARERLIDAKLGRARDAYAEKKFDLTRVHSACVDRLASTTQSRLWKAKASFGLKEYEQAWTELDAALRDSGDGLAPQDRAEAEQSLREVETHLGLVPIRDVAEGAAIAVDVAPSQRKLIDKAREDSTPTLKPPAQRSTHELLLEPGARVVRAQVPGFRPHDRSIIVTLGRNPPLSFASTEPDRTWAYVSAGIGIVGVGLGAYFGVRFLNTKNEADRLCGGSKHGCDTDEGYRVYQDSRSYGDIAAAAWIVGGAGLVGGVVLWMTGNHADGAAAPTVDLGLGTVQLRSTF